MTLQYLAIVLLAAANILAVMYYYRKDKNDRELG